MGLLRCFLGDAVWQTVGPNKTFYCPGGEPIWRPRLARLGDKDLIGGTPDARVFWQEPGSLAYVIQHIFLAGRVFFHPSMKEANKDNM